MSVGKGPVQGNLEKPETSNMKKHVLTHKTEDDMLADAKELLSGSAEDFQLSKTL